MSQFSPCRNLATGQTGILEMDNEEHTEHQSRHQELVAFLSIELEYCHVCYGANYEKGKEDGSNGHIDVDLRSSSKLPYLRPIRSGVVLLLLFKRCR